MYRFLAFSISNFFLSWKDRLLSCADFPKEDAAVFSASWLFFGGDVSGAFGSEDEDAAGSGSGTYVTKPSKMFVMVISTLLVFTGRNQIYYSLLLLGKSVYCLFISNHTIIYLLII